jgi:hypothetical protein
MKIPHWQEMVHARIQFMDLALPTLDGNQWLAAQPIDVLHATNIAGPIVEMEISTMPGDIFSFVETGDGFLAFVQMVFGRDAATPIDFIAWTRDKPWRVYRYFGYADALGVDQLYNPSSYFGGAGIVVRRSPVDWLFANCSGLVILDRNEFANRLRAASNVIPHCRVVGDSVAHARDLAKTLSPLPRNVELFVPSKAVAA